MIKVCVPATSANVGPGFDCMGIAVSMYATFCFEECDSLCISGCKPEWQNEQNLVYQACLKVYDKCQKKLEGLRIVIDAADIPDARGLGSSAVCIVGGALGANALLGSPLSMEELLDICTQMEGHPDNVAPALYGGLTVSFCNNEKVYTVKNHVDDQFVFCAIIPNYPVLTADARRVLPSEVSYSDALFNIGRCAALVEGLAKGFSEIVAHACDDRLHQPYRKTLIPDYDEVDRLCGLCHALTWYISGSGSTMMAIFDQKDHAKSLVEEMKQSFPAWQVKLLQVDNNGATVKEE